METRVQVQTFSYPSASVAAFAYGKSPPDTYGGFQYISFPPRSKGYAAMLHRSMLLGKRLPSDPPLEHEGRLHKRLSIMKVCLWLCIYLCLPLLILISDQWLKLLLLQRFSCDLFSLLQHEVQYSWLILMLSVSSELGRPVML